MLRQPFVVQADNVELTIEGAGFTIRAARNFRDLDGTLGFFRASNPTRSLILNRLTLDANGQPFESAVWAQDLTVTRVTFQGINSGHYMLIGDGQTANLTNVLFRDNTGRLSTTDPSALFVRSGATLTMNNAAFERNTGGAAAITIEAGATVTPTGCLSQAGNVPRFVHGTLSHSLPACTGEVGNGHTLAPATPSAQTCGFPTAGGINADITYTLSRDCRLTGPINIAGGATVTVDGMDHAIRGNRQGILISIAEDSRLNINNIALEGVRLFNYGRIESQRLAFFGTRGRPLLNMGTGTANFNKLLMDRLDFSWRDLENALFTYALGGTAADVTIRDGIFRDIRNGSTQRDTLRAHGSGASITLTGCVSFIRNSPATHRASGGATITDPSTLPTCLDELIDELAAMRPPPPPAEEEEAVDSGPDIPPAPVGRVAPASTCLILGPEIVVSNASAGTSCRLVEPSGYGHQDLFAAMPSSVVDIWGWVTPATQVCFRAASGGIRFVDTTVSPRTTSTLPAFSQNGMVCALVNGAGQVALVPGPAPPAASAPTSTAAETSPMSQSLSNCMVRLKYSLNFRDAPAGKRIGGIPHNAVLTALERTVGWFKVDYHGERGWIAAMYVEPIGTCG